MKSGFYERSHALVIGIGSYDSPSWRRLPRSPEKAWKVACALHQLGFRVELVTDAGGHCEPPGGDSEVEFRPTVLEQVTARELSERVRSFLVGERIKPDDRALVWYSGHGDTWPPTGAGIQGVSQEGLLIGANAPASTSDEFRQHVVPMRELAAWSRLSSARHVLVVLEACFSATVFAPEAQRVERVAPERAASTPARQFIAAGDRGQSIPEDSPFTDLFLDLIRGKVAPEHRWLIDRDLHLTASEIGWVLRNDIGGRTRGNQTPQFGWDTLTSTGGEFVFTLPGRTGETRGGAELLRPPERQAAVGLPFRDCPQCPAMIALPRRPPVASSRAASGAACGMQDESEDPPRIAMSVYEITFDEWDACFQDRERGCRHWPDDAGWGRGPQPVLRVSLPDALEYVRWLSETTGWTYRLPTSAEWEFAARAGEAASTPRHGFSVPIALANCHGCGDSAIRRPLPVGSFGRESANAFQLHDVHGNLWEWVASCADGAAPDGTEGCAHGRAIVRGGSWANGPQLAAADRCLEVPSETRSSAVGFRVVRELRGSR